MRKVYIITYDLSTPGRNYELLLKKIKSHANWARLGGSSYIILSEHSAVEIRDFLVTVLDSNDKIFIGKLSNEAAWHGLSDEVSNWIKSVLK